MAAAKAIRAANIGVLFNPRNAQPYIGNLPAFTLSPSYRLTPDVTTYASFQHGEKSGIAQFVNGVSDLVAPEKTNALEVGVKSALLDKTLIVDADLFDMEITNYQQAVQVLDSYTTALNNNGQAAYTSATGNVPRVSVSGLELDGVYAGIPRTTLRVAGAYNRAIYKNFPDSAQPVEDGNLSTAQPYRNVSGMPLAGAPKYTFNIGADYHQPFGNEKDAHVSANVAYSSSYYSDVALSSYSVIRPQYLTDLSLGAGRRDKSFDLSLLVKNLFDSRVPQAITWDTITPAVPRTWGIQLSGKL